MAKDRTRAINGQWVLKDIHPYNEKFTTVVGVLNATGYFYTLRAVSRWVFITFHISGWGTSNRTGPTCLLVNQDLWDRCCVPLQQHTATLWTTDLHCAPPTYMMHHGTQHIPVVHNMQADGAQRSSVPMKWCITLIRKIGTFEPLRKLTTRAP